MASLFVTGASGFVGRQLLRELPGGAFHTVTGLSRNCEALARTIPARSGWQFVEGDLLGPTASWVHALPGNDVVIHLAAATGKESRARFHAVNVEGTRRLLEECRSSGVRRFVLVSSIATRFTDRRHYHYADSKIQAEALVRGSGLDYAIVRPTMIFGPGSPVLQGFRKLASGPASIVFGPGTARVQPISVTDLARVLIAVAARPALEAGELDAGGPEVVTIENLIQQIRRVIRGEPGRVVHVPIEPLRSLLGLLEPLLLPVLPLTAGQFASFVNDGTAAPHPWVTSLGREMQPLMTMLREGLGDS